MAIEYLGLSSINGPLVVLEGVENAFYDEIVEFIVDHNTRKMGRIVELDEDKKAAMVSNLLVVLCADEAAQPVVNTGTLNH